MKFGNLRTWREHLGMTQEAFAATLGISKTTYNNYETGARDPKSSFWQLVSRKYGVSIDYLLGLVNLPELFVDNNRSLEFINSYDNDLQPALSALAYRVGKSYDALDSHGKEVIDNLVKSETARMEQEAEAAAQRAKIHALPRMEDEPDMTDVNLYDQPATAGTGNYLDEYCSYETVSFPSSSVPYRTDYALRISGDSMEPDIQDGDIVFVENCAEINSGEIGIFILNGESYCKELQYDYVTRKTTLVSHNDKHKDIPIRGHDDLYTAGRVLEVYRYK